MGVPETIVPPIIITVPLGCKIYELLVLEHVYPIKDPFG